MAKLSVENADYYLRVYSRDQTNYMSQLTVLNTDR